jgi:hypothetical protein
VIHAIVRELPDFLANFPRVVGFAVVEVPRQLDVRRLAGHRPGSAGNRDVRTRNKHARPDDVAFVDGIAQRNVIQRSIDANVPHRGKPRFQRHARVGNRLKHNLRSGALQLRHRVAVAITSAIGKMRVAINQAGQDRFAREIDDLGPSGDLDVRANPFNLAAA